MPQVLTANRLKLGEVVYWKAGSWVDRLPDAELLADTTAEETLKAAADWVRRREVVNPYLFEVRVENGTIRPVKMREIIRAAGPTVRHDLGKQAV